MSLQIAFREASDELTTFGRIFMRTYQKDHERKTNACMQISPSSREEIRTPSLRLLLLTISVCQILVTIQYAWRVTNGFCVTFDVPKISRVSRV